MKNILKIMFLLVAATLFSTACTDDKDYDWANPEDGLKLYFSEKAQTSYEVETNQSSVSFWVFRNTDQGDLTVQIDAKCVTEECTLFDLPTTVVFKAGEKKAHMRMLYKFTALEPEKVYEFALAIKAPENYTIYGPEALEFTLASYPEWDPAGEGELTIPFYGSYSLPATAVVPFQHKPKSNFYRIPRYEAQLMMANSDIFLVKGYGGDQAAFDSDLEYMKANGNNLVFQLNDVSKNDGQADWNFYAPFKDELGYEYTQDEGSFMQRAGSLLRDQMLPEGILYATPDFKSGLAEHCSFASNSSVDHNYAFTCIEVYNGKYYPLLIEFNWTKNAFVPAAQWDIKTDYNADFTYKELQNSVFTSLGFPTIKDQKIKLQVSTDKEGLFYLPEAFGVENYGLAFFVKNNVITIPSEQPTGVMQQGMMVYAGPGSGKSMLEKGVYKLSVEYYTIERTQVPVKPSDPKPSDPETPPTPVVDPNDPAYEWPSGEVGVGERYEKVAPVPVPDPEPEPEFTTQLRRISLGSFEEALTLKSSATVADYVGTYSITDATNLGYLILGPDSEHYPGVKEKVSLDNITIAQVAGKDDEVVITGLFSNAANGDSAFGSFAGKDKLKGIYNRVGGYILIYPQKAADKILFPSSATGKPDRSFDFMFVSVDASSGEVAGSEIPLKLSIGDDGTLCLTAASKATEAVCAYGFQSSYDTEAFLNFDLPMDAVLTKKPVPVP